MGKLEVINENEIKDRLMFTKFIKNKYGDDVDIVSPHISSPIDLYFNYKGKRYGVELKGRDDKYLKYDTHILEEIKLNNITNHIHNCNDIYYVYIFSKKMYIYSISEIQNKIKNGEIVKKTQRCRQNHWTMNYINKFIYEVPTTLAKVYEIKTEYLCVNDNESNNVF